MKRIHKSALMVVCLLSGALTLGAAWTTKRLNNTAGTSENPDIAVWGLNVYTVWDDNSLDNFEIYFKKSTDGGATWQPIKRLTNTSGNSYYPTVAASGPNVYVVWHEYESGSFHYEIYIRKSTDGGATWQPIQRLTNNSDHSYSPTIAVSGSNIYVVWYDDTPGNYEIYFIKSTDGGATWQTEQRLTNNAQDSQYPVITVSDSNVYVAWQDSASGNPDIYFRKSTDGGATWQTAKKILSSAGASCSPDIAVIGSKVYIVWYEFDYTSNHYEIYLRKSADGGATWPTQKKLTTDSDGSTYPSIAVIGSNVFVVWQNPTVYPNIYLRKSANGGLAWQAASNLTNNSGNSKKARIAANTTSVFVIWSDNNSGNYDIYMKFSPF